MSETMPADQSSASMTGSAKAERRLLVAGGILVALALAVAMLRFYRLSELGPGLLHDEASNSLDALRVLDGEHAVFFPEKSYGREAMVVYAIALAISFLGRTLLAARLPIALASAGTVFFVFWLGQILFGQDEESGRATPWRGLLVGGVGAALMAVSVSQTIQGRIALRVIFLPFVLSLCLALFWWGWRQRFRGGGAWWRIALAGVCAGLLPYTYFPARLTPFLFLFFGLSFVRPFGSVTWKRVRAELPWLGLFLGVAGLVAAPILVHFALHPDHLFIRSSQILASQPDQSLRAFLVNAWKHLLAFGFRGDPNWRLNFAGQPLLNPWEAFFFWLGVGMAVWRWQRRPAYRLLLLWLGVLILPAMLALDSASPNTLRMIGAAPAFYLLIGVGMWEAFQFFKERCLALPWRASLIFQENETKAAIAVGAVVGGLILVQGVSAYHTYFQKWAAAPEVNEYYDIEWTELARTLNAQPSDTDMVYLVPGSQWSHSFEYLYVGSAPAHVIPTHTIHPNLLNLPKNIESALAAMENLTTVKVVEWNTAGRGIEDEVVPFDFLLSKYGRYVGSDEFPGFRVHNYVDISLARPWTFYEYLEPLTVHYDGGVSLLGLALGQGEEQLASQQLFSLGEDRSLWMGLQWQTSPGLDIDYAISLRLYNAGGEGFYQEDAVLRKPNLAPTSLWSADDIVDTLFHFEFPADLQAGDYELRLIVYNTETLIPTVETGVWEPETLLARLRLAEVK